MAPSRTTHPIGDPRSSPDGRGAAPNRRSRLQGTLEGTHRGRTADGHVAEMQRRRLLTATLELVYERDVRSVTVALVSDRAGVSRKTFYDCFADREACLLGAFEEAAGRVLRAVEHADGHTQRARGERAGAEEATSAETGGEARWRERVRTGLAVLLSFLDAEPVAGRLLVVDALGAGEPTLAARRGLLARAIAVVDAGRREARAAREIPPLTAEGVVGGVFSVIHARMLERDAPPLAALAGPLMAMIVAPYLGLAAARRELDRPAPAPKRSAPRLPADPFKGLPIRLTYRTARVLAAIAAAPGASGKAIAAAAEVADEGQMSKLLTRLRRAGLIENGGAGPARGEANAWSLTARGERVQAAIAQQTGRD
jgi:AcrR family transcriptional regulator